MDSSSDVTWQQLNHLDRKVESLRVQLRLQRWVSLVAVAAPMALWTATAISAPATPLTTIFPDLYQFAPNTPALVVEVNSNFATIRQLAADNQAALTTKLDKAGGVVSGGLAISGDLDVNGIVEVGTGIGTAIRMFNDSDIAGVNAIRGFNDIHLQGDGVDGTDVLIKANGEVDVTRNLRVQGTLLFNRQSCHTVTGSSGRHVCPDGEFMAGMDHNQSNDGNITCCKF